MWQTSLILDPRPNLHQHFIHYDYYLQLPIRIGYRKILIFFSVVSPWQVQPVQAATKVCVCWHYPEDEVFVLAPRASCLVPRATHCHVMTCNDDDITITTGTRLHASMQILSIQRTAMHTTLCTPQHNTGGGSRSILMVSKGSRDP